MSRSCTNLIKLKEDPDTWNILYKCKDCGSFIEEYYPQGERHGSGTTAKRKVTPEYVKEKYAIAA